MANGLDTSRPGGICLFGASMTTGNMGVSALAASLIKIVREASPGRVLTLMVANRDSNPQVLDLPGGAIKVSVANHRLSPRAPINEHIFYILLLACIQRLLPKGAIRDRIIESNRWLHTLSRASFVGNICGGDSFSDIYGLKRFVLNSIPTIIALLLGKRPVLLPQTYGPYRTRASRVIARFILRRTPRIFSRDSSGPEIISRLMADKDWGRRVEYCPDVAFMLESLPPANPEITPPLDRSKGMPVVGFNVNGLMYNGGYTRDNMFGLKCDYRKLSREILLRFMEETDADVILIPHHFGPAGDVSNDMDSCRDIMSGLPEGYKGRVHLVTEEYDQYRLKGIIGSCDFFVGSRMHSCIAALSQGIPAVGIAYSDKFRGVFESVGAGGMVIDARALDEESVIQKTMEAFRNREIIRAALRTNVERAKSKIRGTFADMLSSSGNYRAVDEPSVLYLRSRA